MPRLIPALGQTGEQPLEMDWPDLPPIPTPTYVVTQCSSFSAHLTGVRQAQLEDASEHEKQMSVWALSTHSTAANTASRNAFMVRRQSSLKIGFCLYTSYSKTVSRKKFISNHISKQRFCSTGPQKQYRVQAITRRSCRFKEFPSVTDPKISEEKKKKAVTI